MTAFTIVSTIESYANLRTTLTTDCMIGSICKRIKIPTTVKAEVLGLGKDGPETVKMNLSVAF